MKSMLLMLSILAIAAPAWADNAPAPAGTKTGADSAAPGKKAPKPGNNALKKIKFTPPPAEAPGLPPQKPGTTNCNAPCKVMTCPPPTGTTMCCTTTAPYRAC